MPAKLREQQSFDVFYINYNNETDSYESTVIEARPPIDELLIQFERHFEDLINFDIEEFSFTIFFEDFEKLTDSEIEYFWATFFEKWLILIDEEYLTIDFDEIRAKFSNTNEKKLYIKKMIFFIMQLLPYQIIAKTFQINNIENKSQAYEFIQNFSKESKEELIKQFQIYINTFLNLKDTFDQLKKYIKKDFKDKLIVDERVDQNVEYLNIFLNYIKNSDYDQLKNLIKTYVEADIANLV